MLRGSILIGLLAVLAGTAAAAAPVPLAVLVTESGSTESLSYFGYTFGTVSPPLGKPGMIQIDCKAPDEAELKKALPVGTALGSAQLRISALLPRPQHFSYRFAGAKVTAIVFVNGHFGPTAAISLSFTRLSKSPT